MKPRIDPTGFSNAKISTFGQNGQITKITGYRHVTNPALKIPWEVRELLARLQHYPVTPTAPRVVQAPSTVFERYVERDRKLIGYTAWETAKMPPKWVDGCNLADEVWIPCFHNLQALRDSGVTKPIYVVPHPIDTERFAPSQLRLNGFFTFISVFRWGLRKGWPELFTAYERAFSDQDDVVLRVLTNFRSAEYETQAHQIIDHFKQPGKPRVEILPLEYVAYDFMPILYQNADVFVLPSRGEGFCLPCAEAMACGLPAIVNNATAFTDYVDEGNGYPVACEQVRSEDPNDPDRDSSAWFVADIDDLAAKMQQARCKYNETLEKGARARQTIIDKFGFERVARTMIERLAANGR
ncbi:glycosyltransferase [bacterium]|nr:glycosyltransferase [bacterium]